MQRSGDHDQTVPRRSWRPLRAPVDPADAALLVGSVALVVALATTAVVAVRTGWAPSGDEAFIELRVRDVPVDPPLLGVYSRLGWNHPGPAQFYLLWPAYALGGSSSSALLAATIAGHLFAVLAAAWTARWLDRLAGLAVLAALELVLLGTAPAFVRTPWNPYVSLVASGLLVVLAWAAAQRRRGPTVALPIVATVLVQSHLGNAPLAAATGLAAFVAACWRPEPGRRWSAPPLRPWTWGVALAALLWVPPAVAQVRGDPGRASLLFAAVDDGPPAGLRAGLGVLSQAFAAVPDWLRWSGDLEPLARTDVVAPVWLVVPAAGAVVARRAGNLHHVRGLVVSGSAVLAAAGTAALVTGPLHGYLLVALRAAAAVNLAVGLAAIVAPTTPGVRRSAVVGLGTVAVALAVGIGVVQLDGDNPTANRSGAMRKLAEAVRDATGERPLLVVDPEFYAGSEGVLLQLERAGLDVAVDQPGFVTRVGDRRVDTDPTGRVPVVVGPLGDAPSLRSRGWAVLRACVELGPHERRRLEELTARAERLDGLLATATPGSRERLRVERFVIGSAIADVVGDRYEALVAVEPSSLPPDRRPDPVAAAATGPCDDRTDLAGS